MATFELDLLPGVGIKRLTIDGADVTDKVVAVSVVASENEPHRIRLEARTPANLGALSGDAIIEVMVGDDQAEVIRSWLDNIDPDELDRLALEGLDYGDGDKTATAAALDILKELARGD